MIAGLLPIVEEVSAQWLERLIVFLCMVSIIKNIVTEVELRILTREVLSGGLKNSRLLVKNRSSSHSIRKLRDAIRDRTAKNAIAPPLGIDLPQFSIPLPRFNPQLSAEEATQLILNDALERFAADGVALVSTTDSKDVLQVLASFRRGIVGERFRQALIDRFQRYFFHKDSSTLGFFDHIAGDDRFMHMPLFGFRFSLNGVLPTCPERIMWLGFSERNHAASGSQLKFNQYLIELGRFLHEFVELKSLQAQYSVTKRQSDERAQLFAYASHDMRSPINNLRAILRLLRLPGEAQYLEQNVNSALANCDILAEIVDDALDYSRFKAGLLVARREQVSCAALVQKLLFGFYELANEKGLRITSEVPTSLIVLGDARQLGRIISNLIGNAIKYTDRGDIKIRAHASSQERINLIVQDTGIGMNDRELTEMFLPYKRFGGPAVQGEGLGLALSKAFAELNECTFEVSSTPGLGTSVTLSIPGSDIAQKLSPDASFLPSRESARKLLIVDDQEATRSSLKRNLEYHGFSVQFASSVNEAISLLRFSAPEAVLTDLTLPDGEGETLIRFIVKHLLCKRIIVISGRDFGNKHQDLHSLESVTVLKKPIDFDVLFNALTVSDELVQDSHDLVA